MTFNRKDHWETIYQNKHPNEVSWTQNVPETSLHLIHELDLPSSANIIDIGGGESTLVDFLLDEGFENITVLDISSNAIERAKKRLGTKANKVKWIVSDILEFQPTEKYDLWHDRATFHFLIEEKDIRKYVDLVYNHTNKNLLISTFSTEGPLKCSGLEITQYNEDTMEKTFVSEFKKISCIAVDHTTPFNTQQNFIFCSFEKKSTEFE